MFSDFKKILTFLIVVLAFVGNATLAYYDVGEPVGYVNDYAKVIDEAAESKLEAKLVDFEKETSNEISVVTIQELKEDTIEGFAVSLFEDWEIGKKDRDNGVLLLVAVDDRKMRIEVGYGLEGALTDSQSFLIIEKVLKPHFKNNEYTVGIEKAIDNIIAITKGEYVPLKEDSERSVKYEQLFSFVMIFFMWIVSILGRSKSWWLGGVIGAIFAGLIWVFVSVLAGVIGSIVLVPLGLWFDYVVSKNYAAGKARGHIPWWVGGGRGGPGAGGGFGGFGGGGSGGGGSSGSW